MHFIVYCYYQQEPQAITLGSEVVEKGIGAKRRRVEEQEKMVYIPLLDTLEAVLQNRNVIAEVRTIILDRCQQHREGRA